VVEHDSVGTALGDGLAELLFRPVDAVQAVERPPEAVQIGAVLRVEGHGLLQEAEGLLEMHAPVGVHVAEVVQDGRGIGLHGQRLAEDGLRLVVLLLALQHGAEVEERAKVLGLEGARLAQRGLRVRIPLGLLVEVGHLDQRLDACAGPVP
jgi:hypothetical protein